MTDKEKLQWIDTVSLAIREMSYKGTIAHHQAERINEFAEGIRLMTRMPDNFIDRNKEHFDQIFNEAKVINT